MPSLLLPDSEIAAPITCILSDVDGVMTDGRIIYDNAGVETKRFHVRDGLGIKLWMNSGFQFGILTSRSSKIVDQRSAELGIKHVKQGHEQKLPAAQAMIAELGCQPNQVCYIGDDLPDIPVMKYVGLAVSPADAATDARARRIGSSASEAAMARCENWSNDSFAASNDGRSICGSSRRAGTRASRGEDCVAAFMRLPTRPIMLVRFSHYTTALIFLSAMAVIYQNLVTPWMQPPHVDVIRMATAPVLRVNESLKDLFPEGAWQRGGCKQLQTSDGMLLFQNWEQTNNDQWKLWPVTVVLGRGMSGQTDRAAVIIEAAEGAEIKFTESLDVMSGGAPPIHRGSMIGPVHIYSTGDDDETRSLDLRTANVGIDNQKIWTTEAIEMQVGQARLVGRDLTIHVAGPTGPSHGGSPAVLDRMELIYLDEFVMPMERGGFWDADETVANESTGNGTAANPTAGDPGPAMISIQCGGRVEYDFAVDHLRMQDSVALVHQVPGKLADRFDCESLELKLNDPTNDAIERHSPMDWLVEIIATGSPAIAKLPSFDAELAADEIKFNAVAGLVVASGSKGIRVRRGGINARLARLVYQFDPKLPKAIGSIDVQGPGIVRVDDPTIPLRKAQWRDRFTLQPVGVVMADDTAEINSDVELQVDGDFHAWLADGGEFKADSIIGVLTPEEQLGNDSKARTTLVPDRFQITGNVRIDTAAIAAETEYLMLFFVAEADPRPKSLNDSPAASPLRQWVVQPQAGGSMVDPIARPRPVIRGDSINAELRRNDSGLSAKKLSVDGSVEVIHYLKTGEQTLPAKLTGEHLQLIDGGGEDVLQLGSGVESPARFELGDGFFVGPQIQVRPSDNLIWINAAGEFQMPTAALPTGLAGQPNENIKWIKPPHCRWQGEMFFDGRTAVLSDGVDITASLVNGGQPWDLHLTGDRLQVDLLEGVEVRDMQAMRGATIQRVSLMQTPERPVLVQALRRAADGVLESKHLIHAAMLSLTPSEGGKIVGDGPGWYRGWMIPQSGNSMLGGKEETKVADPNGNLTGIHLIFNDSMQADMSGRNLEFLRGVRVGVRPVADFDQSFDAKTMDSISMGDSTLDCDRLRFTVEPGYDGSRGGATEGTPWEMEATSGVVFRTRNERGLLEGTASRAAYSSSKDLFTVEGARIGRQSSAKRGPTARPVRKAPSARWRFVPER